ncbi:MAG: IclR family transcriptional regulator [Chloroflexota bacterium]
MSTVQSIERAFAILQVVAKAPNGLGVTAIADEVKLHKSTVSRLLLTLEHIKAVERLPNRGGFCIGPGIIDLVSQQPYTQRLLTIVRPYLLDLAEKTGETVGLSIPNGDTVNYIDQVASDHHIRIRDWTGESYPMHVVAAGKLYLAYRSASGLKRYLSSPLAQFTPQSVTDSDQLRQRLNTVREQGYDWAIDEFELGLTSLSVPIFDHTSQPIATIFICGPNFRFPADGNQDTVTQLALTASTEASRQMKILDKR